MKPGPLTDDERADVRKILDAYRAGKFLVACLVGLGSIVGAVGGAVAWWHIK